MIIPILLTALMASQRPPLKDSGNFGRQGHGSFNQFSTEFNGTDEYVNVPHQSALNSVGAYSFFCWVEATNRALNSTIGTKWTYATAGGWAFQINAADPDRIQVFIAASAGDPGNNNIRSTNDVLADGWHHVGFTFNGGAVVMYVDGVAITAVTTTGSIPASMQATTAPFRIAAWSGSLTRYWPGNIDEVTTWSVALSAAQVDELYNGGTPNDPRLHSQAGNLLQYYRLGDDAGDYVSSNEIADIVGGYDGTMANGDASNRSTDVP